MAQNTEFNSEDDNERRRSSIKRRKSETFEPGKFIAMQGGSSPKILNKSKTLASLLILPPKASMPVRCPYDSSEGEHHSRLGEHAAVLWKYSKITDIVVKLRGVSYPAHKTVLSCYSKYFKDMLLESKSSVSVIHLRLPSVTNEAFQVLLSYMYTAYLHITCQNIGEVYTAARKLGMDGARLICTRILTGKTKSEVHFVYIYVTARKLGLLEAADKALDNMARRFERIVCSNEFLDLAFPEVTEFLSLNKIAARSEVIVYLAALKWISVRYLDREMYAANVISCVRFSLMTLNEILACHSPPLLPGLTEIPEIKNLLLKSTCYVAAKAVNEERRFERYGCEPRCYLIPREPLILWDPNIFDPERYALYMEEKAATIIQAAFRGFKTRKSLQKTRQAARVIQRAYRKYSEKINPDIIKKFREAQEEEEDESSFQAAQASSSSIARFPFAESIRKSVSGFIKRAMSQDERSESDTEKRKHKKKKSKTGEENSPRKKSDKERSDEPRAGPSKALEGSASASSSVDALAGQVKQIANDIQIKKSFSDSDLDKTSSDEEATKKVETVHRIFTDPEKDDDSLESILKDKRAPSLPDVSSDDNIGTAILVAGGFEPDEMEDELAGKRMFLYSPAMEEWRNFGKMPTALHHHRLEYLNGYIYFIGGCDPSTTKEGKMVPLKSCFKFDTMVNKWEDMPDMKYCRIYHGTAAIKDKIYVVGGKDENDKLLKSIEVYDAKSNSWSELEPGLETPTMGLGVCNHKGKLWMIGGMVQDMRGTVGVIKKVSCYDPAKKRWNKDISALPHPRSFLNAVTCNERLFVIGGTTYSDSKSEELQSLPSVLYYSSRRNSWRPSTAMPTARHFVGSAVIGNALFVLGGLTSVQRAAIDEVIVHDEVNCTWYSCTTMPMSLCGFACTSLTNVL